MLEQIGLAKIASGTETSSLLGRRSLPVLALQALLILGPLLLLVTKLSTAPALWWDEGWTLAVARNWAEFGHYGQFLAGEPVAPGLAAAPTVVLPAALSFRVLGTGAWQGRLPGVFYTTLALWLLYRLTARLYSQKAGMVVLLLALLTPLAPGLHPILVGKQVQGEVPALCFLLAGYLLLFRGLSAHRARGWGILGAGLFWSLAVLTKLQVVPFVALSLAVVMAALLHRRDWRSLAWCALVLLMLALTVLGWRWFAETQLPAHGAAGTVNGLLGITAFVPALRSRQAALVRTLIYGLPVVAALAYAARYHLKRGPRRLERLVVWVLAASWFAWYLFLSVGWERYLFPAAFFSLIFLAGFVRDVTNDFDRGTLRTLADRLRPSRWRRLTRSQAMLALLLLVVMPLSLIGLLVTLRYGDAALFDLAEYLHDRVPADALIETYDPEIMFLTDQRYHYPPDQVHVTLNRRHFLGDESVEMGYDPLASNPDYLINGPMSRLWKLYPDDLLAQHFWLEAKFGAYELYRYTGTTSLAIAGTANPHSSTIP